MPESTVYLNKIKASVCEISLSFEWDDLNCGIPDVTRNAVTHHTNPDNICTNTSRYWHKFCFLIKFFNIKATLLRRDKQSSVARHSGILFVITVASIFCHPLTTKQLTTNVQPNPKCFPGKSKWKLFIEQLTGWFICALVHSLIKFGGRKCLNFKVDQCWSF